MKDLLEVMEDRNRRCPSDPADKLARKDGICKHEKPGARSVLSSVDGGTCE